MKDGKLDVPSFLKKPPDITIRNRRTGEVVKQIAGTTPGGTIDLGPDEYVEMLPDNLKTPLVLKPGEKAEPLFDVARFADAALRVAVAVAEASEALTELGEAMAELVKEDPTLKEED